MTYSKKDLDRYKYYYKEMVEKFKLYPQSLPLRNGIAHIEKVLGLPTTVTAIDPSKEIDRLISEKKVGIKANTRLEYWSWLKSQPKGHRSIE